jgi:serine/threonine protein kinase
MSEQFDPYHQWLGIPPKHQPPNHYRLLGIEPFEKNLEVIERAADQRVLYLKSLQSGQHSVSLQQLLNELAAARVCLLNSAKKAEYDVKLRERLACHVTEQESLADMRCGSVLGEYRFLGQLGAGRTGRVFKARQRSTGQIVAIKILSTEAICSPVRTERFRRKTRILRRLTHPNLVSAYYAGEDKGKLCLIMEYVDGEDLGTLVKRLGPFPVAQAVDYVIQAAKGLGYAHSHGVYHRNVKPSNLLLGRHRVVKVIGLGLARADFDVTEENGSPRAELTEAGTILGTADYIAPEQALDSHKADHRADIYSLGCTLCTLLSGSPPYPVKSVMKKIAAHRDWFIPSLTARREEVTESLDAVFKKMLAKQPEERYQSMGEVIASIRAC